MSWNCKNNDLGERGSTFINIIRSNEVFQIDSEDISILQTPSTSECVCVMECCIREPYGAFIINAQHSGQMSDLFFFNINDKHKSKNTTHFPSAPFKIILTQKPLQKYRPNNHVFRHLCLQNTVLKYHACTKLEIFNRSTTSRKMIEHCRLMFNFKF